MFGSKFRMKLGFSVSLLLAVTSAWAAPTGWEDLQGCYSTVSYNGQPGSPEMEEWGRVLATDHFDLATMPGVDHISAIEFMLFKYRQADTVYFGEAWIFPGYGNTQISADGRTRTYSFNGPMICTGVCSSPLEFTMETKVVLTDLGNGLYQLTNHRKIPEVSDRSMDADETYNLKREFAN